MAFSGGLVAKSCSTLATPLTIACEAPLSMRFPRQEYWSELPSPGDLPDPGIEPGSPALQANSLLTELPGKPIWCSAVYEVTASFTLTRGPCCCEVLRMLHPRHMALNTSSFTASCPVLVSGWASPRKAVDPVCSLLL